MLVSFVAKVLKCVQPPQLFAMLFPNWLAIIKLISLQLLLQKGRPPFHTLPCSPFNLCLLLSCLIQVFCLATV